MIVVAAALGVITLVFSDEIRSEMIHVLCRPEPWGMTPDEAALQAAPACPVTARGEGKLSTGAE